MKRIKYYDLLRVVCFCFIIFYHMMVQLTICGIYPNEKISAFYSNANMHIATLAVAVFFMLSGASLSYTTKDNFNIKKFYKKRLLRLLIPFYVVEILYFAKKAVQAGSILGVFSPAIPKWRIIFTLLGMDEWVGMHGIPTFSLSIGEWFLGALIILYLLFPLLRYLMRKNRNLFFLVATSIYIIIIYNYSSNIPMHMNLIIKGYEFILGMYFGAYYTKFSSKWMLITIPTVVFFFTSSTALNLNNALKITLLAVAFFVSFSYFEDLLCKHDIKVVGVLSKYSYELFLVHHIVIYEITPLAQPYLTRKWGVLVLFIVQIAIMALFTVIVHYISEKSIRLIQK